MRAIYEVLNWLDLNWDEGPNVGGSFGPYLQSQREEVYRKHLSELEAGGHTYLDEGAVRFRSPRKTVVVEDLVCGGSSSICQILPPIPI